MKIAVPTNDGASISGHFGRSAAFLIFEVESGQIRRRETKPNQAQHSHEQASCGHGPTAGEPHSHAGIVASLTGCDVVICGGMGRQAAEALKAGGITVVVTTATGPADETVGAYLSGSLPRGGEVLCHCRH